MEFGEEHNPVNHKQETVFCIALYVSLVAGLIEI